MINFFWASLFFFLTGALFYKKSKASYLLAFVGSVCALVVGIYALNHSEQLFRMSLTTNVSITLGIDHLSALFIIIASIAWIALSLYSIDYSAFYPKGNLSLGFNLALLGMMLVLSARDGISLLIGWEIMTIFAFIMMVISGLHYDKAYRFLAFGELSTACLLIGFAVLFQSTNSITFDALSRGGTVVLIFLSLGFIIKMDIVPFHGWMRGIYGEMPDNAAAILSGPVTLMGVYGLERIIPVMPINDTWNLIIIALGGLSAFWGGLQAVAVNKVRLLPAYSTVENNGMILTAIGFYALAQSITNPDLHYLALFAQATSIIIALSHTFSKTLLFMSLGHAKEAYDVHTIDEARGVWSGVGKIPALGIVISALSFSAFPPLIGYVGEWMILETLFQSYKFPNVSTEFIAALTGVLTALAIGLIGFAMIKLIGYTALGYDHGRKSRVISNRFMNSSESGMLLLVILCGVALPAVIALLGFPQLLTGLLDIPAPFVLASNQPIFGVISPTLIFIVLIVLLIVPFILYISKRTKVRKVTSWNGGLPLEEEEYFTARAYSQILEHILRNVYHTKEVRTKSRSTIEVEDIMLRPMNWLTHIVEKIGEGEALVLMNGRISAYVTYILLLFITVFIIGMIVM